MTKKTSANLSVLPIQELSLRPELSSPACCRILGGSPERDGVEVVVGVAGRYVPFLIQDIPEISRFISCLKLRLKTFLYLRQNNVRSQNFVDQLIYDQILKILTGPMQPGLFYKHPNGSSLRAEFHFSYGLVFYAVSVSVYLVSTRDIHKRGHIT